MNFSKTFDKLTYSDDFMFCKVMSSDPALCREVIEVCLGHTIGNISHLHAQDIIKTVSDGKGVRLDISASDDRNNNYDLEMQKKPSSDLHERARYYLCMMDTRELKEGEDYSRLGNNYVIFITLFNMFPGYGRHRYTVKSKIVEEPDLDLNLRQTIIYVCAEGNMDDVNEDLKNFLRYVRTNEATDDLTRRLDEAVCAARSNEEWGMEYMYFFDKFAEARQEGLELGREEGLELGRQEGLELGREEGRELGRQEGREEGRQEGLELGRELGREEGIEIGRAEERSKADEAVALAENERARADAAEKKLAELEKQLAALSKE